MAKRIEPKREVWVAQCLARLNTSINAAYAAAELCAISRSLGRMAARECSYEMTDAQIARADKRETRLLKRAAELAAPFNRAVYHQCDPRGAAIYLSEPGLDAETASCTYSNGIACY